MNTNEAEGWLGGGVSGREMILDAALARGDYDEHAVIPPELLVQVAQYDAAMTARAELVMAWAESRRAIIHGTSTQVPERFEWWAERTRQAETERDNALAQLEAQQEARQESERQYQEQVGLRVCAEGLAETRMEAMREMVSELNAIRELAVRTTLERDGLQAQLDAPPRVQLKDALRIVVGETPDGRVEPGDMAYVDTLVVVKGFEQNIEAGWMRINVEPAMQPRGLL